MGALPAKRARRTARRGRALAAGAGVAAGLVAAFAASFAACGGDPIYTYQGQRFDPAKGCLDRPTALDVVEGPTEPRECPAVCLVQTPASGARTAYVAFTCAPYPPEFDATGTDPLCAPALAAAARRDGCLPEGGAPDAAPDAFVPDASAPEASAPEASAPEASAPEASVDSAVEASADAALD
ncbi:MAG TPA: hypothetical protein PLR99_03310 [Polyangiaceae bacterium]|nr:hypothetical protein [Polyangiaceae bacterium]